MNSTLFVFIVSIIFVGLMVLGLSITQIRKGHDLQSEVGENDEMKKRGLDCASHQILREERELRGEDPDCKEFKSNCNNGCC